MIIVQIWEGLGNQLFQYSFAKALRYGQDRKYFLTYQNIQGMSLECMGLAILESRRR